MDFILTKSVRDYIKKIDRLRDRFATKVMEKDNESDQKILWYLDRAILELSRKPMPNFSEVARSIDQCSKIVDQELAQ